jgi:hypothetical protein
VHIARTLRCDRLRRRGGRGRPRGRSALADIAPPSSASHMPQDGPLRDAVRARGRLHKSRQTGKNPTRTARPAFPYVDAISARRSMELACAPAVNSRLYVRGRSDRDLQRDREACARSSTAAGATARRPTSATISVACLLRGGFARVEQTLLEGGPSDDVIRQRMVFQDVMRNRFDAVVEQAHRPRSDRLNVRQPAGPRHVVRDLRPSPQTT